MNIITLLEMAADAFPDRIAIASDGRRIDYRALLAAVQKAAAEVQEIGARYVAHLAVSSPAAPIALFAAALAGVPYVPLNYRLTADELSVLIARIEPAMLIADEQYAASIRISSANSFVEREQFVDRVLAASPAPVLPAADGSVAVQLFTSGTTGQPKAAILRHTNLFSYIVGSVEFASAHAEEATLVSVPPYHIASVSATLSSIYAGRRIVQMANFDALQWLQLCRAEQVTNAFLVPTMLSRIVDHGASCDETLELPYLRAIAYGGGRMPLSVIERAMTLFPGVAFTNAYGLTETSSTICLLGPEDHRAAIGSVDPKIRRRLASVGRALPSVEITVRDHAGQPAGEEMSGRVFVRGPQVSGEYGGLGTVLDGEGWFDTRDRGYRDHEGYLFLEGRTDDVIVRGGENISPGEIEEVLLAHPSVRDAAVIGVPDDVWGEAVAAAVVLEHPDSLQAADLQAWVRDRLRSSRVPEQVRFVQTLPYNELGKLLRRRVRTDIFGN
ncbi:MAG TPA: AMP-binding protein [Steroidobacteraceae bacterium]